MHEFAPDLFLVAEAGGDVVGTIVGGWDGWRGHMARLAISPENRRSRIAHALVREVEERLRTKGARRIYALVDRRNELGRSFWAAVGYTPSEEIIQYSKNLEDGGSASLTESADAASSPLQTP
jgi:ribosomal protein S18 acetylase RimI-like enzyme